MELTTFSRDTQKTTFLESPYYDIPDSPEGEFSNLANLEEQFVAVVEKYYDNLHRLATLITGSPNDAEDALQDAFLSGIRALARFQGKSSLYTWLYRIVINKAKDIRNKRKRAWSTSSDQQDFEIQDHRSDTEKSITDSELQKLVLEKIDSLQDIFREILLLRYFEDMSYTDIAIILQIREGTVKSRLFKAKKQLRKKLIKEKERFPESVLEEL